ncbi:MAG: cation diffusion facilitator family transporter [Chromatiales bacterium]|jgi:cation diffusion facilitator family transporter
MATVSADGRYRVTRRVTLTGAVVNLLLAVGKILLGFIGRSEALIADGIHSLSDLLSDLIVYLAARHARSEPDEQHPYGHGRFETVATLGLGMLLLLVAAGIVWDAGARLFSPERLLVPTALALYGALLSILAKELLYHYTMRAARRVRSRMMRANAWHHRSDAVSSVVVLAGIAGTQAGLPYLDGVAAVLVGVMIAKIGWKLGWGAVQELVDAGLEREKLESIRRTILRVGGVRDLHMLRTRRMGGHASADVHVQVEPWLSVSEGHQISVLVEERLKEQIEEIEDVTVHIDPEDDETASLCKGLPARAEALDATDRAWAGVAGAEHRDWVTLHYLNGRIDADVYFPLKAFADEGEADRLEQEMNQALDGSPHFGRVRTFYG